ncbi:MAG: NAD(P)H-dependent oxidoreductase subunit E [Acetobacteraceae bacterium]|nr:NAD(P)H-dependent oxidoreductase subunit E [Acetobacteraceae bacterium]
MTATTSPLAAPDRTEPTSFAFDAISLDAIAKILAKYPADKKASGTLPLLDLAQRQMGRVTGSAWVPVVAMDEIARVLDIAPVRVYEVATFYLMYNTKPIGRHHLQVCGTTPCWLRGSDSVRDAIKACTGIKHYGETSEDGLFTMSEVECLGGCVNAPILQVDDDYYEDMNAESTTALVEALKRGEKPARGSSIGRQNSAPEGGPLTLNTIVGE